MKSIILPLVFVVTLIAQYTFGEQDSNNNLRWSFDDLQKKINEGVKKANQMKESVTKKVDKIIVDGKKVQKQIEDGVEDAKEAIDDMNKKIEKAKKDGKKIKQDAAKMVNEAKNEYAEIKSILAENKKNN